MSQVVVVSINTAKPGQEAQLEAAMRALIAPTRQDPGFIQYDLHRDLDDPSTFVFVERWASRELLEAHLKTPHIQAWRARAGDLLAAKRLQILDQIA